MTAFSGAALQRVEDALVASGSVRGSQDDMWTCPAHADTHASLHVSKKPDRVLLHCFAGCTNHEITNSIGLTMADLYDETQEDGQHIRRSEDVAWYVYRDAQETPLRRKVRYEPGPNGRSKGFRWEKPDGARWAAARGDGNPKVLHRLQGLRSALLCGDTVYITAGEKDADAIHEAQWPATTNPEGEGKGKWRDEYSAVFRDTACINGTPSQIKIVADKDKTGYEHALDVSTSLRRIGVVAGCYEAAVGNDVSDHLRAEHSLDDLIPIDPAQRLREITGPVEASSRRTWRHLWFGEADPGRSHPCIVSELLHDGDVALFFGSHGTLKTGFALDLSAAVAQGIDWHERTTRKGSALYVAAEGGGGIEGRLCALREAHPDLADRGLVVIRNAVRLHARDDVEAFFDFLRIEILSELNGPLALLTFDTFSQSTPGIDENSSKDVTEAEANIRWLLGEIARKQADGRTPAAILVHHSGKDPQRGPRGSSALEGNLDCLLYLERLGDAMAAFNDRQYRATVKKVKDGPDCVEFWYRGELIHVGDRENGEPKYAPAVFDLDASKLRRDDKKGGEKRYQPKPSSMAAAVLGAMNAIRLRGGELHVPRAVLDESGWWAWLEDARGYADSCFAPVVGVLRKDVVEYLANQGEERSERAKGLSNKDRRNEAIRTLVSKGRIKAFGCWLWWTDEW